MLGIGRGAVGPAQPRGPQGPQGPQHQQQLPSNRFINIKYEIYHTKRLWIKRLIVRPDDGNIVQIFYVPSVNAVKKYL